MDLTNDDIEVFNNTATNCIIGIFTRSLKDSNIYDNTINSNLDTSFGIVSQAFADNVVIRNNTFNLVGRSMSLGGTNIAPGQQNYQFDIRDNIFTAQNTGRITSSGRINVVGNTFNTAGFFLGNVTDILFAENRLNVSIQSDSGLGVNKNNATRNLTIRDNFIGNPGAPFLARHGIRVNTVGASFVREDTNVVIDNNEVQMNGFSWGIHAVEFDGVSITNNTVTNLNHPGFDFESILFTGNNSIIRNNRVSHGTKIQGTGNTVSGNQ